MRIDNTAPLGMSVYVLWAMKRKLNMEMAQWKYNMTEIPNIECVSQPLKHRPQPKPQAKRSPDYSASQDKEMMIKPLKLEYINIHKEHI
jgi:hypothetical protein